MMPFVLPKTLSWNGHEIPMGFPYLTTITQGPPEYDHGFSLKHPKMELGKRAKIFAPFNALDGYGDTIKSKDIEYVYRVDLSEDQCSELNQKLKKIRELISQGDISIRNYVVVSVTYFIPCMDEDSFSFGLRGLYKTISGICQGIDLIGQTMRVGESTILLDCVKSIQFCRRHEN